MLQFMRPKELDMSEQLNWIEDMEGTWKSINRWMDKEEMVHIYNGILLSHTKEFIWVSPNEVDDLESIK